MNRIEFVDESGAVIAQGSGPALAKSLAGEAPLLTKPIVMVGEDGRVTHAGFSGNPSGLIKSAQVAEAIRNVTVVEKKTAPKAPMTKALPSKPAFASKAQIEKSRKRDELRKGALDVLQHRLLATYRGQPAPANQPDGPFAKAFKAGGRDVPDSAKYADYMLSVTKGISDFKARCNAGTRAAAW